MLVINRDGRRASRRHRTARPRRKHRAAGGRRGPSPGSLIWTDKCAGCHGTAPPPAVRRTCSTRRGSRATTTRAWPRTIKNGVPGTEMPAFGDGAERAASVPADPAHPHRRPRRRVRAGVRRESEWHRGASAKQTFRIELVADGLMTPWALAFLPDGRLLVTERDGRLRIIEQGKLSEPVSGVPKTHVQQDGGYFDIEVHPDYARNRWVYLAYSEAQPGYIAPTPLPDPPPQLRPR